MSIWKSGSLILFFNIDLFLRERERERERAHAGGAGREGDTESKAGSRLQPVSTEPNAGLELTSGDITT